MNIILRLWRLIHREQVEAKTRMGTLEVECVVFNADGSVASTERVVRRVSVDHHDQIVEVF